MAQGKLDSPPNLSCSYSQVSAGAVCSLFTVLLVSSLPVWSMCLSARKPMHVIMIWLCASLVLKTSCCADSSHDNIQRISGHGSPQPDPKLVSSVILADPV